MPAAYTAPQKKAIADFISITNADRTAAAKVLKANGWDTQTAVNSYFGHASGAAPAAASNPSKAALSKLFDKYRDDPRGSPDTISITGSMAYFTAIGAELDDIGCLVASEIVQCPSMGEITRDGFVEGWKDLGGDTIEAQKRIVAARRQALGGAAPSSRQLLKAVYKHTFRLGITSAGQRSVDKETCMEFWKMLFAPPGFDWRSPGGTDWLSLWLEFVGANSVKGINSDVWNQTLVFAEESVKDDSLAWWSEEAAWPALVDEFVEWSNEKRGVKKADEDQEMEY